MKTILLADDEAYFGLSPYGRKAGNRHSFAVGEDPATPDPASPTTE